MAAAGVLLGMGNPLLDISNDVDKEIFEKYGIKAGDAILAEEKHQPLFKELSDKKGVQYIAGGATQNSIRVAQWMLQKQGATSYMGCIGKDKNGDKLKEVVKKDGVNGVYMIDEEAPTGTCACCILGKERSLVTNLSAANNYKVDHLKKEDNMKILEKAKIVYSAGFFMTVSPESMELASEHCKKEGKTYCLNLSAPFLMEVPPFKATLQKLLPFVDYLFGNETEALTYAKSESWPETDLKAIAIKLAALPKETDKPRTVVITQGGDPTIVCINGEVEEYPILKLPEEKLVDTNGAGDSYVGGFLSGLALGKDMSYCCQAGAYAASIIVQRSGCTFPPKPQFTYVAPPPKELEQDSAADKRSKLGAGSVAFNAADSTLNVMAAAGGQVMTSLSDDDFSNFLACSRANVGVMSGRYMFEVKILESRVSSPNQKQLVRVGLSVAGSSLFLSDTTDSVCFDSEGFFTADKKRVKADKSVFHKGQCVALLVNLDATSPNADTVSLFINGSRACQPQKLPEAFKGKTLYPTVNYKCVTLQVNFGPAPLNTLPFTCRMLGDAAKEDTEVSTIKEPEKAEVLFPVGLPDQGVADWVDDFVQKNPGYTELSDRKIAEWAQKSGFHNTKGENKPLSTLIKAVAPNLKRNYVYVETKSNLLSADRSKSLKPFSGAGFKKVAAVVMGEPSADYKQLVQSMLLEAKTKAAEVELKKKKEAASRKRLAAERVQKAEAAKKARLAAAQKKNGDDKAEEKVEEEAAEEKPVEEEEITMDPVELSDEEKKLWYRPLTATEMPEHVLAKAFTSFSLPEKAEGFDSISFPWQPESTCSDFLKEYIMSRKLTSRVDDLKPGEWFTTHWKEWQTLLASYKKRQNEWKNPAQKKALIAKILASKKAAEKKEGEEEIKDEEPAELPTVDAEDLDVMAVEDVMDIGSGEPLFANFGFEDWELLSMRIEFHLLVHSFKKDLNDTDRPSFHESHALFYYQKYFKKQLDLKSYNVSKLSDLANLIKECLSINSQGLLEALMPEDSPIDGQFVKLAEEHRRDRQRRIDAGDETAELKFKKFAGGAGGHQPPAHPPPAGVKRPYQQGGGIPAWQANKQPRAGYQPVRR